MFQATPNAQREGGAPAGSEDLDGDLPDPDGLAAAYLGPLARFDLPVAQHKAVFDELFRLAAAVDEIEQFEQFVEFDVFGFKLICHTQLYRA
jgi:hypothetical protein